MNQMLWANLKRTWTHHFGTQMTTLIVLAASYAIICSFLTLGQNLRNILSLWGDSIQMTVFLKEETKEDSGNEKLTQLKTRLQAINGVDDVKYVSKQEAAEKFKMEMSGFMPEVFQDEEFIAPFPSSFIISFKDQLKQKIDTLRLAEIAKQISGFEGAEDIAYGQDWLNNYASFIKGINSMGLALVLVLLSGSVFVVGTSIKTSISARRDEIEIMELVGATSQMIRWPLVVEGLFLGLLASTVAGF
ncbi:MAG: permease-like cell division protein FtsX [Pseudomonadota bacterium]|nr:permease-like cell division protein FtsX [Pseudomonadota bacterium]